MWWRKHNNDAIEFFDVSFPTNNPPDIPTLKNFRSTSITQISTYLKTKWSECIQENVTLPADTLHLDRSDSSADDKTCEDNEEKDAHVLSSNVLSETEADLITCNKQLHNKEIASEEATSDSELESRPHKQMSMTNYLIVKVIPYVPHPNNIVRD